MSQRGGSTDKILIPKDRYQYLLASHKQLLAINKTAITLACVTHEGWLLTTESENSFFCVTEVFNVSLVPLMDGVSYKQCTGKSAKSPALESFLGFISIWYLCTENRLSHEGVLKEAYDQNFIPTIAAAFTVHQKIAQALTSHKLCGNDVMIYLKKEVSLLSEKTSNHYLPTKQRKAGWHVEINTIFKQDLIV